MPNASGVWSLSQQFQARGQGLWPAAPGAPTIGTATAGSSLCASVTFTAPGCTGYPAGVTSYTVTSTPGCVTKTGASSPLVVTGLTNGTSYTFKVKATGSSGLTSVCSAASNSITASSAGQQAYTAAGTYSWVAPTGVTSVSVVAVGGGYYAGGGLGYKNNISVTPGSSYTVSVGAGYSFLGGTPPGNSYFISAGTVQGSAACVTTPGGYTGDGGGSGGQYYGGGAGGYSGAGGQGKFFTDGCGTAGSGGGGGGGAGYTAANGNWRAGGGGGVGILGQGSNGAGGTSNGNSPNGGGGGSGGTAGGFSNASFVTGNGGVYGGGSGRNEYISLCQSCGANGGGGAVRIIWPGDTRKFPSTCTGDK